MSETLESSSRRRLRSRVTGALLLCAALLFAGLFFHQKRVDLERASAMSEILSDRSADAAQLRQWKGLVFQRQKELRKANALIELMADPSTRRCVLEGRQGRGQAFFAGDGARFALFAFDLPPLAEAQRYQAWGRGGDSSISLGVLSDDVEGVRSLFGVPARADVETVVVSVESNIPAGPSEQFVLRGKCGAHENE